ncbi:MAG: protein kinase [Acidobacteriota bacterium]|nr:protein kinase [Acidobacteriota bacterium]
MHRLEIRQEGFLAARRQIEAGAGERLSLRFELEPQAPPPPVPPAPRAVDASASSPSAAPSGKDPAPVAEARPAPRPVVAEKREVAGRDPRPAATPREPASRGSAPPAPPAHRSSSSRVSAPRGPGPFTVLLLVVVGVLCVLGIVALRRLLAARRGGEPDPPARLAMETRDMPHTGLTPTFAGPGQAQAGEGSQFGPYRIMALLGRGGMASTYRARRVGDEREMALKIPYAHLLEEQEFVARFLREGGLGATLHHPNIVRIFEAGEQQGVPFIAMELLRGETLEARIARVGRLELREALDILRGIALALDYAHLKGVVHRDLKPENVMCLTGGGVKVMDYGIARVLDGSNLTASHSFLGTPNYAAPESFDPARVDGRSDLYSLGIIAYRMLAGRLPFTGGSPLEILDQHRRAPLPALPGEAVIPPRVEAMVRRMTDKSPARRFESAEALLRELNAILNALAEISVTEPTSS